MSHLTKWAIKFLTTGNYLCLGKFSGWDIIEYTPDPWRAKHFDSKEYAISYKNNESHIRHVPMLLVELSLETGVKEHGLVPLTEPDNWPGWRQPEPEGDTWWYDDMQREEAAEQYADVYKQHGLTPPPALPENLKD